MEIYDVLHRINSNTYAGLYTQHSIDDEGWIEGYEIISKSPIIYVFEFEDAYGYVEQDDITGKYFLDIENVGYVKDRLCDCYRILSEFFEV